MSQNIFLIGASGFVGSALARHFLADGHRVLGLARTDRAEVALRTAGISAGPFGALLLSACSRSRDPRTRTELGWKPTRLDLLSEIGDPRLRALANPQSNQRSNQRSNP